MKRRWIAAVPALALLVAMGAGAADAAPVVTDWFAALPTGSSLSALIVDTAGSVFTANSGTDSVTKLLPDGSVDTRFASDLPTGSFPVDLVDDEHGNIYVSGLVSSTLYRLDASTGRVDTVFSATLGSALDGRHPSGLALDAHRNVFAVDTADQTVAEISPAGVVLAEFPLEAGAESQGAAFDDAGNLYIANSGDDTVSKISFDTAGRGTVEKQWASLPAGSRPVALAADHHGHVFVAAPATDSVIELDLSQPHGRNVIATIPLPGTLPLGITSDALGNVYTSNTGDNTVTMIPVDGAPLQTIAALAGSPFPQDVAAGPDGAVYTANNGYSSVSRVGVRAIISSVTPSGAARVGVAYSANITATGVEPVMFGWSGTIPAGLHLDAASGAITGTPTVAGRFEVEIVASNVAGVSAAQHVTFDVRPAEGSTGCWYWREPCGL